MKLELPEDLQRELHQAATRNSVSDEEFALVALREYLDRDEHRRAVREAGNYVQNKNAELYRRLG